MKTRIAPSPTGYFHLGTLRTALLNFLMAKANNGTFQLRVDDTDQDRNKIEYIDYIYSEMKKFGLTYNETFRQSSRLNRYKEVAKIIGTKKENHYEFDMGDYSMVILRDNGYPTYNFASILDDYDSDVTHIIRGVDHIANLSKQEKIFDAICKNFGVKEFPTIIHAGLLFNGNEKLSKRNGTGTTADLTEYSVEAILNWLFKLGWSHPDANFDKTYKTLDINTMIQLFNEGKISKSNCKIDYNKLEWLNKKLKKI
jgi:glutamyl/glutaminyl-tRNA synthetase